MSIGESENFLVESFSDVERVLSEQRDSVRYNPQYLSHCEL